MQTLSKPLMDFILDFTLENSKHIICFDSTVYCSSIKHFVQVRTEVQIQTVKGTEVDVVRLLSPEVEKHLIPEVYVVGRETFKYIKDTALVIKGDIPIVGKYVLSIHPRGNCDEKTLKEIHGKIYN